MTTTEKPKKTASQPYTGFEQGPIRPPSEAYSLLIRVSRNCPWNRCAFCPVYKGRKFSLRPVDHVKRDIDAVHRHVTVLREALDGDGRIAPADLRRQSAKVPGDEMPAFQAALHWMAGGMESIFLQDANSLIIKPADLIDILTHLSERFPWVARITSYARSHTVARISDDNLRAMRAAGLNRIHIGMESGADRVLASVNKGVDGATHVKAGRKVVAAGMELSEYVMPGLGGRSLSREHALGTADALNRINPHFIRLRTLAIPNHVELFEEYEAGRFDKLTDRETVEEILLFLDNLSGITSTVKSDHVLNLFQEVEGNLPEDAGAMTAPLRRFLAMSPAEQCLCQVGRRLGIFSRLSDLDDPERRGRTEKTCRDLGITPENVDRVIDELMKRFI